MNGKERYDNEEYDPDEYIPEEYNLDEYDPDEQMEHALGAMMEMDTPFLDLMKFLFVAPMKLLLHPAAVYGLGSVFLESLLTLDLEGVQEIGGFYLGTFGFSMVTGGSVLAIKHFEKEISESPIRKKLSKIFQNEGMMIHSYSKGGLIPRFLFSHSHLAHDYNGFSGGDLITLHYRGYAVFCCNVVLTQSRARALEQENPASENSGTGTFVDQYKGDDIEAAKRFKIDEGRDVVFYGSVFIIIPGPDLEGHVSVEAADPIAYLRNLKSMEMTDLLTNPERAQDKQEFFHYYHRIGEENDGNASEKDRVFSQRVKDMILQLEMRMRAPVGVYADKDMVCLTIQKKAFDFDCIHELLLRRSETELENTLIEKVNNFRKLLDIMIGPKGDEYTELLGTPSGHRKSVYSPILDPVHPRTIPEDNEICAYVEDLAQYTMELYRFSLQYNSNFQRECASRDSLAGLFLTRLYNREEEPQAEALLETEAGKKLTDSMTNIITDHFRELWSMPGKCSVKTINRIKNGNDKETIKIDISIFPPIKEWNDTEGIDKLVALMSEQAGDRFYRILHNTDKQNSFLEIFKEKLGMAYGLSYDVEYIYTITMKLLSNDHYGFTDEEVCNFCNWYLDLLKSNRRINGVEFK